MLHTEVCWSPSTWVIGTVTNDQDGQVDVKTPLFYKDNLSLSMVIRFCAFESYNVSENIVIVMIDVGHLKSCVGRQLDNGNAMPGSVGKAGQGLAALEDGWASSGVHPQPQPTLH